MTAINLDPLALLIDALCGNEARIRLLLTAIAALPDASNLNELTLLLNQKLSEQAPHATLPSCLKSEWLLTLACGKVPPLNHRDLQQLAAYLSLTPSQLCTLLYPEGHGPGSGAFYAEFPFFPAHSSISTSEP